MDSTLLRVNNLKTYFRTDEGIVRAVDGVDFEVNRGEILGIVGESGSGKSMTVLSILKLISGPYGRIESGRVLFDGVNILNLDETCIRKIRGNKISMIFQEPMTSLNPVYSIGEQIAEAIEVHKGSRKKEAIAETIKLLELVGIPLPEKRVKEYPHQLSGGMRQRAMIAMALACRPKLLIADEPTTALDVTIQAQILELIKDLQKQMNMSVLLITHDLGVIAEVAHKVIVMYAGKVMEKANVVDLFVSPLHPYTKGLLDSIPKLDDSSEELKTIKGMVPRSLDIPKGCRFYPRCNEAMDICSIKEPGLISVGKSCVRCWKYSESEVSK